MSEEIGRQIIALAARHPEPWRIEKESHDYSDGTTHFTHVVYDATDSAGNVAVVLVGEYVSASLAELMVLLKNNAKEIGSALVAVERFDEQRLDRRRGGL